MNRTSTGVLLAAFTGVISGVSIFVNSYAVKQVADPAVFTTLKNGVAAAFLLLIALAVSRRHEVQRIDRRSWLTVGVIGLFGGGLAFLLFFTGLAAASAPSAAFIHKTLFVWVAFLAVPFLGERLGIVQVAALGILLLGQFLIAPPTGVTWGVGETMIAAATLIWAVEAVVARRVLATVPPAVLGAGRLGIGLVVLGGYVVISGRLSGALALGPAQWVWVLGTGALLAGYVATWFAALQRAPASVVTAVLVIGAPITAMLAVMSGGSAPTPAQSAGYVLIALTAFAVGAVLIWRTRAVPDAATA